MISLFLNTASNFLNLVLIKDEKVIDEIYIKLDRDLSKETLSNIKTILDRNKLLPSDVDELICTRGPGSFTGVRLGVTIAKTLAYTKNIPIKTITSLECMAISSDKKSIALSDGNGYYIALFDKDMGLLADYKYINLEEINNYKDIETDVTMDYEKIYEYANKKDSLNPHLVNPIYIKKIGVEQ